MANTSVFTGADGSISLSPPQSKEGEAAKSVLDAYNLLTVGRVQNVRVEVTSAVRPYHEIGERYATELRPGNINVTGTIGRAYINGALLKLMLGEAAEKRPTASWVQPSFDITLLVQNPAVPGISNTLTIYGAKLTNWVYSLPEDDFVMESAAFQALYLTVADEAGS
jgi:hypothetical protein